MLLGRASITSYWTSSTKTKPAWSFIMPFSPSTTGLEFGVHHEPFGNTIGAAKILHGALEILAHQASW